MKKLLFSLLATLLLVSCKKETEAEKAISNIDLTIELNRYDKEFYESKPEDLAQLKLKFPSLFPEHIKDSVWIAKMNDTLNQEIYREVQKKYPETTTLKKDIEKFLKLVNYHFPKEKLPKKATTIIAEVDYRSKAFYTDSILLVSLDLYLGKDHYFYEFPEYLKQNFEYSQIIPDLSESFARNKVPFQANSRDFISRMIYEGKILYLKYLLSPSSSDASILGYTDEQLKWAKENEENIWRYFIDENLLYSSDNRLMPRFIDPAPFSKFYLDIDNESPGKIGCYIGWEIVKAYMKNNQVNLDHLIIESPKVIFEKSKYKPKK